MGVHLGLHYGCVLLLGQCRKASEEEERGLDHIYIAYLRLYFLNYLDSYRYAPKLRHVSSAIAETVETADVAELEQEKFPDDVPNLKQEVWPDTVPDLKP